MRSTFGIAILGLALAGTAAAQTATAPKPATSKSSKPAGKAGAKAPAVRVLPGMSAVSPAGLAILAKLKAQGDPELVSLVRQQRQLRDQLSQAVIQPTIDVDQIEGLTKQGATLQAQIQARQNDRLITALKALPDEDRAPFLRAVAVSSTQGARPTPAAAAPAAPAAPVEGR